MPDPKPNLGLTIGDLATRTGLSVSAIRFHEAHGIIKPLRHAGGHRRYAKIDLRRIYRSLMSWFAYNLIQIARKLVYACCSRRILTPASPT